MPSSQEQTVYRRLSLELSLYRLGQRSNKLTDWQCMALRICRSKVQRRSHSDREKILTLMASLEIIVQLIIIILIISIHSDLTPDIRL